ncbi:conserved hypothetical protein [Candidatus Competibacter denitrificans Run_A_D11]|uniref:DUF2281 domain-containing protein n=1 Tax=Candidatus Competibacter denitrificans Run_A_D11 TaxID=1400863 RepID=W6M8U2_9GAMM|nr:DUF2281 domain-containing protein [Candidatus Competibacter denitrificans]CDI02120.1 conserved hypothetical protein [Candidatus Competibacter denitrificans Run_A_D11]HRC70114.1 DUF2281 domain-containing protein [Candidatus Competibacter denitrificans]
MIERIITILRDLPPERQAEILDFAEFLKKRTPRDRMLRPYGFCAGEFQVPDDFDAPLPGSEMELFEP